MYGTMGHSAFQGLLCTFCRHEQQSLKALWKCSPCDDTHSPLLVPKARDCHEHFCSLNMVMKAPACNNDPLIS